MSNGLAPWAKELLKKRTELAEKYKERKEKVREARLIKNKEKEKEVAVNAEG